MVKKIRIGVIPAGGKGARISPLSKILPKPMVPVLDRPVIDLVIRRMISEFGVEEVYIIVGPMQDMIKAYFNDGNELGIKIRYVDKQNAKGIGDAINLVKDKITEPFIVILGDDFTIGSAQNLAETFFEKEAYAVEAMTKEKDIPALQRTCCAVLDKTNKIIQIVEKPQKPVSDIRGCGMYIFHPKAFEYLKKMPAKENGKGVTDLVGEIAKDGKAYGEFIKGTNININTKEELFLANLILVKILEKEKKIDMDKVYKFLDAKYNRKDQFWKKIGFN